MENMAKVDHFNLIGPIYDWVFGRRTHGKLIELVNLSSQDSLLDIGGGTGWIAAQFAEISPHAFIADSAIGMLREAQRKGLCVVNGNSEQLPFCSGCFDRIIMVDVFHHVANHRQTLDEIWRLLAPGGRLVIEEPDIKNGFVKIIALVEKLLLMRSKFIKPKEIQRMHTFGDVKNASTLTERGVAWIVVEKDI